MSTEPNHESTDGKTATQLTQLTQFSQADTAVAGTSSPSPEDSDSGSGSEDSGSNVDSDECSMDSLGDSMTTDDTTSLTTTSLVDAEKMCNGIMSFVRAFKADISKLEMKNKKLLSSLAKAKRGENDAVEKLIEVEDKNIKLQEKLNEMEQCGGARDFMALKGKCHDLEKQIVDILDIHAEKEKRFEDYQAKREKQIVKILENRMEKNQHFDDLQAKMEKLQLESQKKLQELIQLRPNKL
jgi:hypothetical protein